MLTVLIYTESGYIGIALSDFFGGMFGIIKYIVPIGAFAVSVKMACKDDDGYLSSKILQYALLMVFVAVILSVYEIYNGEINIEQNIVISDNISAPISQGEIIGKLEFRLNGDIVSETNLVAKDSIDKIGFFSMEKLVVGNWFVLLR